MIVKIEGCTAESLKFHSPYLSLEKQYRARPINPNLAEIRGNDGDLLKIVTSDEFQCAFLPQGGRWVTV